jgi:hypothetical protein
METEIEIYQETMVYIYPEMKIDSCSKMMTNIYPKMEICLETAIDIYPAI